VPTLAKAVPLIASRLDGAQFVLARVPNLDDRLLAPLAELGRPRVAMVAGRTDDVLAASDVVVTASGTATVQAAIHERPMVIVYRLSPLTYRLGKPFVKVDTFGMVNLVAGESLAPELIQDALTPQAVASETVRFFTDPAYAARTREGLRAVRRKLGAPGASRRAAEHVLAVCDGRLARPQA
jgi:lipid-A-disaccharide synthase